MKLIIYGGRDYADWNKVKWHALMFIKEHLSDDNEDVEIVSGACSDKKGALTFTRPDGTEVYGADGLSEKFAAEFDFPVKLFHANWEKYGISAGPIRNYSMGKYGTHALGFPGGKGTANMTKSAKANNLILREVE